MHSVAATLDGSLDTQDEGCLRKVTCAWIGCAGWSLPRLEQAGFPEAGSHLERYASRFPAVEVNSSFHRPHRMATYARWKSAVPSSFRFSVKVPKVITHTLRLQDAEGPLEAFLAQASGLGDSLGCFLVQLPPSLSLEAAVADRFFAAFRARTSVSVACEPRHPSWFLPAADDLLAERGVARVAADPARVPAAAETGGWAGMAYYRLHGSPRTYYSAYSEEYVIALASRIRETTDAGRQVWCIFDNTALGAATGNALALLDRL